MVEHIVLFRWTPGATQEQIEAALEGLRGLAAQIPGIVGLSAGEDFSGRGQGYTHGLIVRFRDRAALEAYSPHPAHRRVVEECINPIRGEVLGFDYETPAASQP